MSSPPVALTIAGFDTSAGAGLQADLLTFHNYGFHPLTAMTSLVVETPLEVTATRPVSATDLENQVHLLLHTYPIATIKIGLLAHPDQVMVLAKLLKNLDLPIVLDPVGISSSGSAMQMAGTSEALAEHLAPLASLITPNLPEALSLSQEPTNTAPEELARRLSRQLRCAVLLTGGHHGEGDEISDFLVWEEGEATFRASRLSSPASLHGTGCVLSSAISAELGLGRGLEKAVAGGRDYLRSSLAHYHSFPSQEPLLALNHHLRSSHDE
ncbi:hydroxymethylpyrimidine/phosphomethylpyrimidine kinase [Roseibacillus persicicus]|uniref:bifunctional hydroxymethylpyrimidine kinase/phosphomethylpyrimidine kinase n=1 Tax=Roseibacillus persicicus TaxID=454148 RepID=UPI00398B8D84